MGVNTLHFHSTQSELRFYEESIPGDEKMLWQWSPLKMKLNRLFSLKNYIKTKKGATGGVL